MDMDVKVCTFKWKEYSDHLWKMMQDLMITNKFTDVTIVCDDKKQIKAHRNILSACSPVLRELFMIEDYNNNPVIYMRGTQHADLALLMEFMYTGEAAVDIEKMDEFFRMAESLKIKQLIPIDANDEFKSINGNTLGSNFQKSMDTMEKLIQRSESIAEAMITTDESANECNNRIQERKKFQCKECRRTFSGKGGLWYHKKAKHEGLSHSCNQCDYKGAQQRDLKKHIKIKHEGLKYDCQLCDYQATYIHRLKQHIQIKHEGLRYLCKLCDQQFKLQDSLKSHIQAKHKHEDEKVSEKLTKLQHLSLIGSLLQEGPDET